MRNLFFLLSLLWLSASCASTQKIPLYNTTPSSDTEVSSSEDRKLYKGFFNFWWEEKTGKILLEVDLLDTEFLYVNSLTAGIGSNDIGLDRGQLGQSRVVKFIRSGPKLLLIQPNYKFRAESDNSEERRSVEEAFASSVLWGFDIIKEADGKIQIDLSSFLLRDAHGVVGRLNENEQGAYKSEASRSAIYLPGTMNFPKNTEFESLLTFVGKAEGDYVLDVVPTPDAISVRQHHSFIELPDQDYSRRIADPRSGYMNIQYQDYATPIDAPLVKRFIRRHRLKKKDPSAAMSEALEPIVYYVDRGAPEPILSALIEGASWWNQAFEAAGYRNAFQVKVLPADAHPLDVRYNVIQWVHRATRGWSYGGSVTDPRTGEIIKGHVSLGSLRVRQDFLIAQGLLPAYKDGKAASPKMEEMALARLRQLSAHEVGHTLGLMHNFAASTTDRASVMDYPHPYLLLGQNGDIDFGKAYDDRIGAWDIQVIKYGYQDFPKGVNEAKELEAILQETISKGLRYISDDDARPLGGAHPYAHLWDNGGNAVSELSRLLKLRRTALQNFGKTNLRPNAPMAELEEVLAPLYLMHRYQLEAVSKLIGGLDYTYAVKGDGQSIVKPVLGGLQEKAIAAMIGSLHAEVLDIPESILKMIPPKPPGYSRGRESFSSRMGLAFDPFSAAESIANVSLMLLLHPERASRLVEQHAANTKAPGLHTVLDQLMINTWKTNPSNSRQAELGRIVDQLFLKHLFILTNDETTLPQVRAIAWMEIEKLEKRLTKRMNETSSRFDQAHYTFALKEINRFKQHPEAWEAPEELKIPDGSPIGTHMRCEGH